MGGALDRRAFLLGVLLACDGRAREGDDPRPETASPGPGADSMGETGGTSPDSSDTSRTSPVETGADTAVDTGADTAADTGQPPDTGGLLDTGDTGGPPPACLPDPDQAVLEVSVLPGFLTNQVVLSLGLAVEGTAAVVCAADDRSEEHLVESSRIASEHTFELVGLRPATPYTCRLAPVCPAAPLPGEVHFTTGDAPRGLPNLRVEPGAAGLSAQEWTLAPYKDNACSFSRPTWLLAWDREGTLRWWYELPDGVSLDVEALWQPGEGVVVWGGGYSSKGRIRKVDLFGRERYAATLPGWESTRYHHDAKALADGTLLTLEERTNRAAGRSWLGFAIRRHDPASGELLLDFDSQVLVDEGHLRRAGGPFDQDPYHANWVDYVDHPDGPALYASLCLDQSILRVDPTSGELVYRVAREAAWLVYDGAGAPLPQTALPQCAHGLEVLAEDHLLLYDNGRERDYSSVSEWTFYPDALIAIRHWIWSEPDWHEGTLGDVDLLGPDRVWITQSHAECWSETRGDRTSLVELEPSTQEVVLRLTFPSVDDVAYRSQRYDGCAIFDRVDACPERAARREALREFGL